jgi:Fe-S cluster assembly iron-binding protein IscA
VLEVTDRAASLLREIQTAQEETAKVLRLLSKDDQFELTFDMPQEEDQVFQSEGTNVLAVAPEVADVLADATIDAQDTPEGPRLTLASRPG